MRQNLQSVLRSCAGSLGLDLEPPKDADKKDEVESMEEDKHVGTGKRLRAMEPFGGVPGGPPVP